MTIRKNTLERSTWQMQGLTQVSFCKPGHVGGLVSCKSFQKSYKSLQNIEQLVEVSLRLLKAALTALHVSSFSVQTDVWLCMF